MKTINILRVVLWVILSYMLIGSVAEEVKPDQYMQYLARFSYISNIDMPPEQVRWALDDIAEFNSFAPENVVSYTGYRPIMITNNMQYILGGDAIGVAVRLFNGCVVVIDENYTSSIFFRDNFRIILLHEILHCYGYDHVDDETDIMYATHTMYDPIPSLKVYANDIFDRRFSSLKDLEP